MNSPPCSSASRCASRLISSALSTTWQCPPAASIRAILRVLVPRGITATKGMPSIRATCASLTAVEPEEASITGMPGRS